MSREDLNRSLFYIGQIELEITTLQAEMDAAVDAARRPFAAKLERRRESLKGLARELRLFCEDSREHLTPGKAKFCGVTFGKIGWRKQLDKLAVRKGVTAEQACARLLDVGHDELVRTEFHLEKKPTLAAIQAGRLSEAACERAGLYVKPGREDWWYEVDHETVQQHPDA